MLLHRNYYFPCDRTRKQHRWDSNQACMSTMNKTVFFTGAMTPVLHMHTGSPMLLKDLNEATGVSNADAQSLSKCNYLQ